MHTIQPPKQISYPLATAIALAVLIGGLLPNSQATTTTPSAPELSVSTESVPQSAPVMTSVTVAPMATPAAAASTPLLEDDPEFAPKFQHVVARKRATRLSALDRISCSWSGSRLCAHSAGL